MEHYTGRDGKRGTERNDRAQDHHRQKAMVAQVFLAKGAIVPEHHHERSRSPTFSKALKFELEGKEIVVSKGQVLRIPPTCPTGQSRGRHARPDIFSPIHHDWLKKDDARARLSQWISD